MKDGQCGIAARATCEGLARAQIRSRSGLPRQETEAERGTCVEAAVIGES